MINTNTDFFIAVSLIMTWNWENDVMLHISKVGNVSVSSLCSYFFLLICLFFFIMFHALFFKDILICSFA